MTLTLDPAPTIGAARRGAAFSVTAASTRRSLRAVFRSPPC